MLPRCGFAPYDYPVKRHWVRWFPQSRSNTAYSETFIPFWVPALVMTFPLLLVWKMQWRRTVRIETALCPSCAYDRRDLAPNAPCPECGKSNQLR